MVGLSVLLCWVYYNNMIVDWVLVLVFAVGLVAVDDKTERAHVRPLLYEGPHPMRVKDC